MKTHPPDRTGTRGGPSRPGTAVSGAVGGEEHDGRARNGRVAAPGTGPGPLDVSSTPPAVESATA
ncbi:hypothetical protein A6A08_20745 [Nocardiopsis sp. TSRI0078]|uniref:hypothetical protein n=1 Tax=unclassified Nocardiopsis TaxID=2649073 RepID=UPI00093C4E6C|nr:hypothetical protein [Nocardiopsis sp. TSRI0078]OKI22007.1 hypothetical protein A6A08_20745 [Nocardiopsis sp. TSRI0078]